ncbi:MAG: flagellar biosynthetic protein FliO, partial [Sandaracinaceae bacterium]|nr:flagellar biosynthetic protein FliO [Sandaracinaceae bacterium]
ASHASAARDLPGGYGTSLLQSLLALGAVCILAWVVLRWSAQRGLGLGQGQRVKVIERVPLDARRWVYLVQIGERVLVVGAGDGASPTLLTEMAAKDLPDPPKARSFLEVLRDGPRPKGGEGSASPAEGSTTSREGSASPAEGSTTSREGSTTSREASRSSTEGSTTSREALREASEGEPDARDGEGPDA